MNHSPSDKDIEKALRSLAAALQGETARVRRSPDALRKRATCRRRSRRAVLSVTSVALLAAVAPPILGQMGSVRSTVAFDGVGSVVDQPGSPAGTLEPGYYESETATSAPGAELPSGLETGCYEMPDLGAGEAVILYVRDADYLGACRAEWALGNLQDGSGSTPPLVACSRRDAVVAVLPAPSGQTCADFDLTTFDPSQHRTLAVETPDAAVRTIPFRVLASVPANGAPLGARMAHDGSVPAGVTGGQPSPEEVLLQLTWRDGCLPSLTALRLGGRTLTVSSTASARACLDIPVTAYVAVPRALLPPAFEVRFTLTPQTLTPQGVADLPPVDTVVLTEVAASPPP